MALFLVLPLIDAYFIVREQGRQVFSLPYAGGKALPPGLGNIPSCQRGQEGV